MPLLPDETAALISLVQRYGGYVGLGRSALELILLKLQHEPDNPRQLVRALRAKYPAWTHQQIADMTGYCRETVCRWLKGPQGSPDA